MEISTELEGQRDVHSRTTRVEMSHPPTRQGMSKNDAFSSCLFVCVCVCVYVRPCPLISPELLDRFLRFDAQNTRLGCISRPFFPHSDELIILQIIANFGFLQIFFLDFR